MRYTMLFPQDDRLISFMSIERKQPLQTVYIAYLGIALRLLGKLEEEEEDVCHEPVFIYEPIPVPKPNHLPIIDYADVLRVWTSPADD